MKPVKRVIYYTFIPPGISRWSLAADRRFFATR